MHEPYVPSRGDLVWLEFQPTKGHEQSGRRPALVLSAQSYNRVTGLVVVCPVTSRSKRYPFEVSLPEYVSIVGVILADHVRNLDWNMRNCEFIEKVPEDVTHDVLDKLSTLFEDQKQV